MAAGRGTEAMPSARSSGLTGAIGAFALRLYDLRWQILPPVMGISMFAMIVGAVHGRASRGDPGRGAAPLLHPRAVRARDVRSRGHGLGRVDHGAVEARHALGSGRPRRREPRCAVHRPRAAHRDVLGQADLGRVLGLGRAPRRARSSCSSSTRATCSRARSRTSRTSRRRATRRSSRCSARSTSRSSTCPCAGGERSTRSRR